jgi:hypothetical protein
MAIVSSWRERITTLFMETYYGVNCPVKSGNERDPYLYLLISSPDEMHSRGTARVKWEEEVGDGRLVWSEIHGLHAAYNGWNNGLQLRKKELIL